MAFPQTRMTLIGRIAAGEDDLAWGQFLGEYWRPICLFAMRIGNLTWEDGEDVASATVELLSQKDLLQRWLAAPQARFKTLICSVVRNIIANRSRSDQARTRRQLEYAASWREICDEKISLEDLGLFYGIWAEELVREAVNSMMWSYHREQRGDYFRVLHGRICDCLSSPEIAAQLGIKITDAENYFRHARQRLTELLHSSIQREIERVTPPESMTQEFQLECTRLGQYLAAHGGLEGAIRRAAATESDSRKRST